MKIFVALPIYDGKVPARTLQCLLDEQSIASGVGDEFKVDVLTSNAGIISARNQLTREFLDSDSDKLFFLDSDITFPAGSIVKLAHQNVDVVGGVYRHKKPEVTYPVAFLNKDEIWAEKSGLIEVAYMPTGFLCIDRSVFKKFETTFPERAIKGNAQFSYWQMPYVDGVLYGEDFYFCKEWIEMGGKVYMDPELELVHWCFNPTAYPGHIGKWLKNRIPKDYIPKGNENGLPEECLPQGL